MRQATRSQAADGRLSRRTALALGSAWIALPACAAAPRDLAGWREARWGMREVDLEAAFPGQLERVEGAYQYFDLVVPLAIPVLAVAGRPFAVLFQLDPSERRLRQVLLRYRASRPTHGDFVAVATALAAELGPPEASRADRDYAGSFPSFMVERRWRFATTSVRLFYSDPNAEARSRVRKDLTLRYYPTVLGA